MKLPFLELDYTASVIDIGISHHSMDNQQKKEHLMKRVISPFRTLKVDSQASK
jgi:hypothetical protein